MNVKDTNTPLYLMRPDYDFPYEIPTSEKITSKLALILSYLKKTTPANLINKKSNVKIASSSEINEDTEFAKGDFRLTSYEWGVTYAGMMNAGEATGNMEFTEYASERLKIISELSSYYFNKESKINNESQLYPVLNPRSLDDAGSLCASMIKAQRTGLNINLRPLIENFMEYITIGEYRFSDGTLARNRPYPDTLWLDDLFMSVPALSQMAAFSGEVKYFDDAVRQVLQYSKRIFNSDKKLYSHAWIKNRNPQPAFYWGRANGWAVMAMIELLGELPESHTGFKLVAEQFKKHVEGLAACQSISGLWHQLLDRSDTYMETSSSAIITYSIARAVNLGVVDKWIFAPIAVLGWNAVSNRINNKGQVEGSCVGTGIGFDPAYYSYRPVNVSAAQGYGPVLLAGAETIRLIEKYNFDIIEGSLQLKS